MSMLTLERAAEVIKKYAPAKDLPVLTSGPSWLEGRALELWNLKEVQDQSKHDAKFYLACLRLGRTDEESRAATLALPAGKAHRDGRSDDSYWRSTVKWAHEHWSKDQEALLWVRKCPSKRALEERFIEAAARVYDEWPAVYEKALKRLKKRGVRIGRLEKAIAAARAKAAIPEWDAFARHAVSEGQSAGWWYKGKAGWVCYSSHDWARNLTGRGVPPAVAAQALSDDPWTLVAEPFQPEELPGRRWNRNSAALKHKPKEGPHPTWDQMFRVLGRGLDAPAKKAGFESGGQYLFLWVASMIQRPQIKLPYIFFHGEKQQTGKSSFHEAIKGLLERGYVLANEALENTKGFNGELHGAVICVGDEIEVGRRAYKRIKQWTTGEMILIHPKGKTAYQVQNNTHWIQTGNELSDCPMIKEDTRIVACHVWPIDEADRMPKQVFLARLDEEGPAVTHTLLSAELPEPQDRLGLPVLVTLDKVAQQDANMTDLESWLQTQGDQALAWSDTELVNRFLDSRPHGDWSKSRVLREISRNFQALRRLAHVLRELPSHPDSQQGVWRGSVTSFLAGPGSEIASDWPSREDLGSALNKHKWPGVVFERYTRSGRAKRFFRVSKAASQAGSEAAS